MKTITFYSEKGGVGKTSFGVMYASWLKYRTEDGVKGPVRSAVMDYNNRISDMRVREIDRMKNEGNPVPPAESMWPIFQEEEDAGPYTKDCHSRYLLKMINGDTKNGAHLSDYDVLVLDFPGAQNNEEFIQLFSDGLIGAVMIPVDRDPQTYMATLSLARVIGFSDVPYACFFNTINLSTDPERYRTVAKFLRDNSGLCTMPTFVTYTERLKKEGEPDAIRSTFSWPKWTPNSRSSGAGEDPGLENLFIDITRLLARCPDIPGTPAADLSFAERMKRGDEFNKRSLGFRIPYVDYDPKTTEGLPDAPEED